MSWFAAQEGRGPEEFEIEVEALARAREMAATDNRPTTTWEDWA